MKPKRIPLLILGVCMAMFLQAQTLSPFVVSSSGGFYSNGSGSLAFTTAEMTMVQTFTQAGGILTQGFQQPEDWSVSIQEESMLSGNLIVYPNPTQGIIHVDMNALTNGKAVIRVFDMPGRLAINSQMNVLKGENTTEINISSFARGIYFLEYIFTGSEGKKESKVFKINLVN